MLGMITSGTILPLGGVFLLSLPLAESYSARRLASLEADGEETLKFLAHGKADGKPFLGTAGVGGSRINPGNGLLSKSEGDVGCELLESSWGFFPTLRVLGARREFLVSCPWPFERLAFFRRETLLLFFGRGS